MPKKQANRKGKREDAGRRRRHQSPSLYPSQAKEWQGAEPDLPFLAWREYWIALRFRTGSTPELILTGARAQPYRKVYNMLYCSRFITYLYSWIIAVCIIHR